jgi:hypothetical protein
VAKISIQICAEIYRKIVCQWVSENEDSVAASYQQNLLHIKFTLMITFLKK